MFDWMQNFFSGFGDGTGGGLFDDAATATKYGTTPGSEQTARLAEEERGMDPLDPMDPKKKKKLALGALKLVADAHDQEKAMAAPPAPKAYRPESGAYGDIVNKYRAGAKLYNPYGYGGLL